VRFGERVCLACASSREEPSRSPPRLQATCSLAMRSRLYAAPTRKAAIAVRAPHKPRLPKPRRRLHPPPHLFDELPFPLAHRVAGRRRGARIDGRASALADVLCDVRRDDEFAAVGDEALRVVALVRAEGDSPGAPNE